MAGFSGRFRRQWTAAEKGRIVGESCASGATVVSVARRHGVNPSQLYAWRREAGFAGAGAAAGLGFVPVVVETAQEGAGPVTAAVIEIVVGPITVRQDAAVEAAVLHRVMDAARRLA